MTEPIRIDLLGPVIVRAGESAIDPGPPQQQALLAALALRRGVTADTAALTQEIWGVGAPASAAAIIRNYVHRLRRNGLTIASTAHGYAAEAILDLDLFEQLVADADDARATGDRVGAAAFLRKGLALWRGPALAGVVGPGAESWRTELEQRRLAALTAQFEIDIALGRHHQVLPHLRTAIEDRALDEHLRGLLMTALYRAGRQADAIAVYQDGRRLLRDMLGVDPAPELQSLYTRILRSDPALRVADDDVRPAQLPATPAIFVGRGNELLRRPGEAQTVVIAGMAGVGKTTLAVQWSHRHRDWFVDGQLYTDLRGYSADRAAAQPADVLEEFLRSLGVAAVDVPSDLTGRASLFRTLVANRRMLILLDNANSAGQVLDLLPGAGESVVVVTSRNDLPGLLARTGARLLRLEPPDHEEALDLLAARVADDRIRAEPAAHDLVDLCGRLPLALTVVAARATARPHVPLAAIAAELRAAHQPLDALRTPDDVVNVRSALSWSYGALSEPAARTFRCLGAHPGPDVTVNAAASMLACDATAGRATLDELTSAHLLTEHRAGRFTMHDLVRSFAGELADPKTDRGAVHRMLDHYLHTTHAVVRRAYPVRHHIALDPPLAGVLVLDADPVAWFDEEHPVLLAALDLAVAAGFDRHAWQLSWLLRDHLNQKGLWHQLQVSQQLGAAAAARCNDPVGEAYCLRGLAVMDVNMGRHETALARLRQALGVFLETGEKDAVADCRNQILAVLLDDGDKTGALDEALKALALYPPGSHPGRRAAALNTVSWAYATLERYEPALVHSQEATSLIDHLGPHGQAAVWDTLGYIQSRLGDCDGAEHSFGRAIELYQRFDAPFRHADTLVRLGQAYEAAGRIQTAEDTYRKALSVVTDNDDLRLSPLSGWLSERLQDVHGS
ncbi:BTAD domain-containing putative transcriptional regulator [Actinoplanes sp. NPDC051475]|uniref:AfsR/SARP family transcriptional regulator n=1 Tax=Actinoplanes sp. NPDC051475 TaxID=3157225 RepID=UPI00344DBBD6